jgi:hypothetical protein
MTTDEKNFITQQGLPDELLIDAKGQSIKQIEETMKSLGKVFAYNSTPCDQFGHTIRTRAGHCVRCDTARIAFILRHLSFGTVYIAGSINGQLIKIGTTSSKLIRAESLNRTKYGNQDDWEILFSFRCLNSGAIEFETHKVLKPFLATNIKYQHEGRNQKSNELFRCSYKRAKDSLLQVIDELNVEIFGQSEKSFRIEDYNFRTLRKL